MRVVFLKGILKTSPLSLQDSIILNVGGKRHEVRWDTLDKFPNSRLGRLRHSVSHRGKTTPLQLQMERFLESKN